MIKETDLKFKLAYKNIILTDDQLYDLTKIINYCIDNELSKQSENGDYDTGYDDGYDDGHEDALKNVENLYVNTYNEAYDKGYNYAMELMKARGEDI